MAAARLHCTPPAANTGLGAPVRVGSRAICDQLGSAGGTLASCARFAGGQSSFCWSHAGGGFDSGPPTGFDRCHVVDLDFD